MAILKANYMTRTQQGTTAKTTKAVSRAAKYYTFRPGPDREQRQWHRSTGETAPYAAIKSTIREDARTYGYSYRLVVSTKDADIGAAGYHQVLRGRFERYYFVEHHNTDFPHCHVIGFRKQVFKRAELQAMRAQVLELEQTQQADQTRRRHYAQATPEEALIPAPRRRRDHERTQDTA